MFKTKDNEIDIKLIDFGAKSFQKAKITYEYNFSPHGSRSNLRNGPECEESWCLYVMLCGWFPLKLEEIEKPE